MIGICASNKSPYQLVVVSCSTWHIEFVIVVVSCSNWHIEFVIAIWIKNIPSKSLYGQLAHFKWENWDFSELCTIDYNHMRFLHVLWQFDWAIFEGVVEVWQEWLLFLVIFLTMTVWGLREEWLVILLTIIVRQRNGLCG